MRKVNGDSPHLFLRLVVPAILLVLLGGCASDGEVGLPERLPDERIAKPAPPLKDGTPPWRADLPQIPDAIPRPEPLTATGNKTPYQVLGRTYVLQPMVPGQRVRGLGSWYGTKFHEQKTSLGEDYDVYAMTAAHKTLPIPCYLRVTNLENGRQVVVRVNDRGPFHSDRMIDLSYAAAYRLGYADKGTALLEIEMLDPMAPEWVARRGGKSVPVPLAGAAPVRQTWVQAGAFRSIDTARNLQQTLAAQFGAAEVAVHSGSGWHRVRVGPLITTAALEDAKRRLAAARLGTQVVTE
jgi:rare lipoprotein A